ncbi:Hypoxanthine phosphoribosyltransferase [Caligus rogercresseyi]|uniref:Hypoxanthine phosphoribosyltransferase n=1 Tax=Caligus rogercresseyi TaxID=217165 RepID=A0A7T8HL46_CALRO|nr:Hypoxanthine phosphoribosyltransferase [Caligus rogercresseyi]
MSLNMSTCLNIPDDFPGYEKELFHFPERYTDIVDKILVPHGLIRDRVYKIAADIEAHYLNSGIRHGAYKFFGELNECLSELSSLRRAGEAHIGYSVQFIRAKSYENASSSGIVKISGEEYLENELQGHDVLVVEDIVDTGATMVKLLEALKKYNPNSVRVASLVRKRTVRSNGFKPDFVCFEVPDSFIIGYAFDFNDFFRDIPHICTINQANIGLYKDKHA